ncbi:hypothetical protein [Coraliomargarita akajimensis]|uniref:Uncharacterized protein n=1 Tax=Coraliomargarita akajimensis (strain DSM 45221 / IAM 15411 / JCM 23193 / KCTC 12865 / 04OKA010-24) TaxID=583355 RepID=D5EMC4_CORAD|nr:hypothetical protein [Coraliomargarita akajimensis]ADE53330.1 hypothetical protein Caka_0304 [Coraliomargarita akajimensis DSM 45221]
MQTTQNIQLEQLHMLLESIFQEGNPVVKESYSDFDKSIRRFESLDALKNEFEEKKFHQYSIYYPEAKGHLREKRIELKPGAVEGHTHRYSIEGWGLISLQCNFRNDPEIECRIAVNSESRAKEWFSTCPELKSPDLWEWNVVKKQAGRLTRLLRKLAKEAEPVASGQRR